MVRQRAKPTLLGVGLDKDKDGFTNLEEYEAQPESTSPTDAKSHPPYALKLLVEKVVVDPFLLRFKAVITMPDGSLVFQLNLRGDRKTHFVKMNEVVEGFKLMKYEEKRVKQRTSGFRGEREVDVSEVTLQRGDKAGDKVIVLVKGKEEVWSDYSVVLYFTVDKKRFDPVKKDSVVTLRDEKYVVISIDSKEQSVVIRREDDGKEFTIRKTPEKEEEKSPRGEPTSIPGDQGENRQ